MRQILLINNENKQNTKEWIEKNTNEVKIKIVDEMTVDIQENLFIVNAEIEITQGWMTAMEKCANSYPSIGTVSPMLENELFQCNEQSQEDYHDIPFSAWGKILEHCNIPTYPSVSRNLFDCLLIKKEVLAVMGVPDVSLISDGSKAKQWFEEVSHYGWQNKIDCMSMIKGNKLYNIESDYYDRLSYIARETIASLWSSIHLFFDLHFQNGRKNILHYLLADYQEGRKNNVGGTQFHVSDLVRYQKGIYNVFVLARDGENLVLTEYVDETQLQFEIYVGEAPDYNVFFDRKHEDIYRLILQCLRISLVHIHHTMWMPLNMYYVAQENNIPIILSIHDYYYACPVLKMINNEGEICNKESCQKDCIDCLKMRKGLVNGSLYLKRWRQEHNKVFEICSQIIFPSDVSLRVMTEIFPDILNKSTVVGHGTLLPDKLEIKKYTHDKLRVAFIGGISDIKGGPVIYDLITKDKNDYQWYLMGGIGYSDLYNLKQENLIKTGWYKRYEIYSLLSEHEIDIVCILSTVAETFCYTLSEAVAMGIPVIATDVGALGQRVREMQCGWLVPRKATAEDIFSLLRYIQRNIDEYEQKRMNISAYHLRSIDEMGEEYDLYYERYINTNSIWGNAPLKSLLNYRFQEHIEPTQENKECQSTNSIADEEERIRLIASERELSELKKSIIIQMALKLRRLNFPGKVWIKSLFLKLK